MGKEYMVIAWPLFTDHIEQVNKDVIYDYEEARQIKNSAEDVAAYRRVKIVKVVYSKDDQ